MTDDELGERRSWHSSDRSCVHMLNATLPPAGGVETLFEDERMARALHFALNGLSTDEPIDEPARKQPTDEELARRLQAEEEAKQVPPVLEEDDATLAARLAAEFEAADRAAPVDVSSHDDAALAAEIANADRAAAAMNAAENESASLALALSLSQEASPTGVRPDKRRTQQRRDEQLRQHLFSGGANHSSAPASAPAYAPPGPPPIREGGGGPSFACVLGHEQQQQRPNATSTAPAALSPTMTRPRPPATGRPLAMGRPPAPSGPILVIDGANVAFSFGLASRAPSGFDPEGIRRAVDYFADRAPPGRRVPRSAIAVTLSETRWDPSSHALAALDADGVLAWTPTGKDDDVFLLQSAADHAAWVITNDRWTDHRASRHATQEVRKRVLRYAFVSQAFSPASDDVARFDAG